MNYLAIGNVILCLAGLWVVLCRANLMSREETRLSVRAMYTFAAVVFLASAMSPWWGALAFLVLACSSTSILILMLLEDWLDGPPSYTCRHHAD